MCLLLETFVFYDMPTIHFATDCSIFSVEATVSEREAITSQNLELQARNQLWCMFLIVLYKISN